jgi:tRNA(adenine34) deaminase
MEEFMRMAYKEAQAAAGQGEVPVGAVIVRNGKVIAKARNSCIADKDMTRHAELKAIAAACRALGTPYLTDCALYVTLEPCPMCMGALINARVGRLVYGADDFIYGACGGYVNLAQHPYAKNMEIYAGMMQQECAALLTAFFKEKR